MYATHEKLVEFNKAQQELVTKEIDVVEDVDYLQALNAIASHLDHIRDIKTELLSQAKQSIQEPPVQESIKTTKEDTSPPLLFQRTEIKTLKRICIDFFNKHGPDMVDTYLKINPPTPGKRGPGRPRKKGKTKSRFGYYNFGARKKKKNQSTVVVEGGTEKKRPGRKKKVIPEAPVPETPVISETVTPVSEESAVIPSPPQEEGPPRRRQSRAVSRVNYVDDIPDSVLYYVERQESKRRKMEEKVILESIKEASKQQQQQLPSPAEVIELNGQDIVNAIPPTEISEIGPPVITSVVSLSNGFVDPTRLFFEHDVLSPEFVNIKSECQFCGVICDNLKTLAMHNMEHLRLRIRRVGEKEALPVNLRRGVMLREGGYRVVRCSSCLKTFRNADQIKQHWNTKNCEYYCPICYLSFHRNPERIEDHLLSVHGIRKSGNRQRKTSSSDEPLKLLEDMTAFDQFPNKAQVTHERSGSSSGGFKLKVRSVSMINATAPTPDPPAPTYLPNQQYINDVAPATPPLQYTTQMKLNEAFGNQYQQQMSNQRAVCHICHCSFPNINSRNSHMKIHKRLSGSSTSLQPTMSYPMPMPYGVGSSMNNDYMVNVRPCGFRYYNRSEFIQLRSECKDCRYACTMCIKIFQSGSELQMHLMLEHPRSLTFKR